MHPALEAPRRTGDEKIVQATSNQAIEGAGAKCWPWIERDTASLLLRYRRHNNVLVMSAWSAFANPHAGQPKQAMFKTQKEAEGAAPGFGCKGAHPMGSMGMVCAQHEEAEQHGHH